MITLEIDVENRPHNPLHICILFTARSAAELGSLHAARFFVNHGARSGQKKNVSRMSFHFSILFLLVFSLSLLFWRKLSLFPLCVCFLWVHAQHHARDSTPHEARSRHERKNHKKDNINNRDVLVVSPNDGL